MVATVTPNPLHGDSPLPAWLATQPPPARTAFLLCTRAGLDYAQIGARLGCDRAEVVTLLRVARDAGCTYRPWEDDVPLEPPRWLVPERPALASSLLQVWWVLPAGALLLVFGWLWLLFVATLAELGLPEAVVGLVLRGGAW